MLDSALILRIAGLSATKLAALSSRLAMQELPPCLECEEALTLARSHLELWLSDEIGRATRERRSQLLTLRRDCRQGKSLERYRNPAWQQELPDPGARYLEETLLAEGRLRSAWERFDAAYERTRQEQGESLPAAIESPGLLRGLALGSTSLVAGLRQRRRRPLRHDRKERRLEEALARYASRAALKLSPFSTLTRTALAEVRDIEECLLLRGHDWRERSLARVPRIRLEACLGLLHHYAPFRERLQVSVNEAREETAPRRYLLLRPGFWKTDFEARSVRYVQPSLVEAEIRSPLVSWLITHLTGKDLEYRDLVRRLSLDSGTDRQGAVDELLTLGFLVLRFPWNSDDPQLEARLLEHVRSMPEVPGMEDLARILAEILSLEEGFPTSSCPEADLERCHELSRSLWAQAARLAGIDPPPEPPADGRSALYEDVFLVQDGRDSSDAPVAQVGRAPARALLRTLDPLMRLVTVYDRFYDFLVSLAALCAGKLPGETEVPWLTVLRLALPLWKDFVRFEGEAGRAELPFAATFNPLNLAVLQEWQTVRERVAEELSACVEIESDTTSVLSPAGLSALLASVPARPEMPRSTCFFLQPVGPGCGPWVLNRTFEGGRHHSRYTSVMSEEMRSAVTESYRRRSTFEQGGETWELVDILCPAGKVVNVHVPQTPRVLEMPGERSSEPASRRLSLRHLRVVLPGAEGLPFLMDQEGRRILPVHAGPILLQRMPLPLKLLRVFGTGRADLVLPETSPVVTGDVKIHPRLAIDNVIVRRRRWVAGVEELRGQIEGLSPARCFAAVERWRRARGIPDQVFLSRPAGKGTIRDKPLFVDFTSPVFVELFRGRVEENQEIAMEEVLPAATEGVPDESGGRWAIELQLDEMAFHREDGHG
ncbi:MAG TPA: lantibiotic dehydratase [Thermoanaerobaculia bacterium]|nr:lantibiotic dehydratase [Thermoanaerobaculia bacterium]